MWPAPWGLNPSVPTSIDLALGITRNGDSRHNVGGVETGLVIVASHAWLVSPGAPSLPAG